jgi:hypothetical protein
MRNAVQEFLSQEKWLQDAQWDVRNTKETLVTAAIPLIRAAFSRLFPEGEILEQYWDISAVGINSGKYHDKKPWTQWLRERVISIPFDAKSVGTMLKVTDLSTRVMFNSWTRNGDGIITVEARVPLSSLEEFLAWHS